ncbi:Hypothetical predicted protein [Olea europaea subsp. europaea]|uniref:Uncharacterized protein n=1 Tax=Olea europaea subsp. europaea TaxID=158383 RepID=A0A8S0S6S7_OLEEU|nr:Hypothetical predicted protein [Olea europaea subsp. europaea]
MPSVRIAPPTLIESLLRFSIEIGGYRPKYCRSSTIVRWGTCPGRHVPVPNAPNFAGMQATSRPCPGRVLAEQECRLIFRCMKAAWCAGHARDAGMFPGISRQFIGYGVQAMSRMRPGWAMPRTRLGSGRDVGKFSSTRTQHGV